MASWEGGEWDSEERSSVRLAKDLVYMAPQFFKSKEDQECFRPKFLKGVLKHGGVLILY